MEKRKISTQVKVIPVKNLLIVFFLGGIIFSTPSCRLSKNTGTMPQNKSESFALLNRILELNQSGIGNSAQIILVTNDSIHSKDVIIQTFEMINNHWIKKFDDIKGTIGRNGFSSINQKREGDNTSPTGIFNLGPVFGYSDHVVTKMDYRQATEKDYWIDDVQSPDYNRWITMNTPPAVSHEEMRRKDDLYKLGIVVQYNTKPILKGNGSAIFVHIQSKPGSPTSGCVAMPENNLDNIIRWLEPEKKPLIIMGTVPELERIKM